MHHLTVLQLNDLHGYASPHPELFDLSSEGPFASGGGLARVAGILGQVRRDVDGAVVALDSGDTFHGTLAAVRTAGEALVGPMGALGLDGMTAHWEFAYGIDRVRKLAARLPYPMLAANLVDAERSLALPPFTVIDRAGVKVGVIGLAAVLAAHLVPPAERPRLALTVGDGVLRSLIPMLRREHGVQLVIVLSHLGFPQDCKLARVVPGIDVLVSGHTHHRLEVPVVVNDTIIIQSGAHGSFVGRLDLTIAPTGIAGWTHALLPVDATREPDAAMSALVDAALIPFAAAAANVLAETTVPLHRYAMLESSMDVLLLDATAAAAGTVVALSNAWRYGAPIEAGPITEADVWAMVPADPPVSVVTLTGAELRRLYEDNLEATFACDPWAQRGGYLKRCRGLEMAIKIENPPGHRLQELRLGGARLRDEAQVSVAFLGEQAVPAGTGRDRRQTGITAIDAVERYLRDRRSVSPACPGHVKVV